jgi:hypothetical protein
MRAFSLPLFLTTSLHLFHSSLTGLQGLHATPAHHPCIIIIRPPPPRPLITQHSSITTITTYAESVLHSRAPYHTLWGKALRGGDRGGFFLSIYFLILPIWLGQFPRRNVQRRRCFQGCRISLGRISVLLGFSFHGKPFAVFFFLFHARQTKLAGPACLLFHGGQNGIGRRGLIYLLAHLVATRLLIGREERFGMFLSLGGRNRRTLKNDVSRHLHRETTRT